MATGDVKIKLILDGKEFEAELQKSKKSVKDFKKETEDSGDGIGAAWTKIGLAIGAVTGVLKGLSGAFDAVVGSSQAWTDSVGQATQGIKGMFEVLTYSIANVDFSPLTGGLDAVRARAEAVYTAFDNLANVKMSGTFRSDRARTAFAEQMVIARDKSRSMEEREAAQKKALEYSEEIGKAANAMWEGSLDAIKAIVAQRTGISKSLVTPELLERAFLMDTESDKIRLRAEMGTRYEDYQEALNATRLALFKKHGAGRFKETHVSRTGAVTTSVKDEFRSANAAYEKELLLATRALQEEYAKDIVAYAALGISSDEDLGALITEYKSSDSVRRMRAETQNTANEVGNTLKNEKAAAAIAAQKRAAEAAELERMRAVTYGATDVVGTPTGISLLPSRKGWQDVFTERKKPRISGIEASLIMPKSVQALNIESPWEQDQLKKIEKLGEALQNTDMIVGSLSSSFSNLGSTIGGAAGNMLEFVGNTLECIQQMIPLIGYIQAEAIMRDQNASAAMKEAAAKTLSAYAGIPFAGVALGRDAVSSIVAAVSSLPKFAEGCIVTSATMGIFGEAGPEAVMPLDRLHEFVGTAGNNIRVQGEIVGRGKDLVVVIDNYNKTRKVR